jgi:hypothetical protein
MNRSLVRSAAIAIRDPRIDDMDNCPIFTDQTLAAPIRPGKADRPAHIT